MNYKELVIFCSKKENEDLPVCRRLKRSEEEYDGAFGVGRGSPQDVDMYQQLQDEGFSEDEIQAALNPTPTLPNSDSFPSFRRSLADSQSSNTAESLLAAQGALSSTAPVLDTVIDTLEGAGASGVRRTARGLQSTSSRTMYTRLAADDPVVTTTASEAAAIEEAAAAEAAEAARAEAAAAAAEAAAADAAEAAAAAAAEDAAAAEAAAAEAAAAEAAAAEAAAEAAAAERTAEAARQATLTQRALRSQTFTDALAAASEELGAEIRLPTYMKQMLLDDLSVEANVAKFQLKITDAYKFMAESYTAPFTEAGDAVAAANGAVDTATSLVETKYNSVLLKQGALDDLLTNDPFSPEIPSLREELRTAKTALNTSKLELADKLATLGSKNESMIITQKTYNTKMGTINGKFVKSVKTMTLNNAGEVAESVAQGVLDDADNLLNDFPSYTAEKQATFLNSIETDVEQTNVAIEELNSKVSTQTDLLQTRKSQLDIAEAMGEETQAQKFTKIKALTKAQTAYKAQLKAVNAAIDQRNTLVTTRESSLKFQTLEGERPGSAALKTFTTTEKLTTPVAAASDAKLTSLRTGFQAAGETEMTALNAENTLQQTRITTVTDEVKSLNNTLEIQETDIPASGAARQARQLRIRNTVARLSNATKKLNVTLGKANSAYRAANNYLSELRSNFTAVGTETTSLVSPQATAVASVDEALTRLPSAVTQNKSLMASLRTSRASSVALNAGSKTLNMSSRLGRSLYGFSGLHGVLTATRDLFRPASYAAAALPEALLAPTGRLTSALSRSSAFLKVARVALPFLRVAKSLIGPASLILEPILFYFQWQEASHMDDTYDANISLPDNYSMLISDSTRDNQVIRTPTHGLRDTGHDGYNSMDTCSYLTYLKHYAFDTGYFGMSIEEGKSAAEAYFSPYFAHFPNDWTPQAPSAAEAPLARRSIWAPEDTRVSQEYIADSLTNANSNVPEFNSNVESNAFRMFCFYYDYLVQVTSENIEAGYTPAIARARARDAGREFITAAENGHPLTVTRIATPPGSDQYTYGLISGYDETETAGALALLKNDHTAFKNTSPGALQQMGLPPEASSPDFVGSAAWLALVDTNPYYQEALITYSTNMATFQADAVVQSYRNLLQNVPAENTQVRDYLLYQLQILKGQYEGDLSDQYKGSISSMTDEEGAELYNAIFTNTDYISFQATWSSGTSVYTPLISFTSGDVPSWFSVGPNSAFLEYADNIPGEIENENLQNTLNLVQQLGVYDFTASVLGVGGKTSFNEDHVYTVQHFSDLEQVHADMLAWEGGDYDSLFGDYRLTGDDGNLLNNLYTTYRGQLVVEKVALAQEGAYNVLLSKIELALLHPELSFNALNEKDETGNSVSTVATMQLNGTQLAHQQALYNANPNIYLDYPPEVLQALGVNPNLSQGELQGAEDVGSNVAGGQAYTDDQVATFETLNEAVENNETPDAVGNETPEPASQ